MDSKDTDKMITILENYFGNMKVVREKTLEFLRIKITYQDNGRFILIA